jgi:hypothetical protein
MNTQDQGTTESPTAVDDLADQVAAALAPHSFTDKPRDADAPRRIRHTATSTSLPFGLSGVMLGFYIAKPGTNCRREFHSIRLGYSAHGLPLLPVDVEPIVFLAHTLVAEFTVQDDQLRGAVA